MRHGGRLWLNPVVILSCSFCVLMANRVNAAFEHRVYGSSYLGAGSTGLASPGIAFATLNNPAKLVLGNSYRVDVFYSNFYAIKNLEIISIDIQGTYMGVPLGMAVTRFGNTNYRETDVQIAAAYAFLGGLFALKTKWYNLEISGYGSAGTLAVDAAGMYSVHHSVNVGFYLHNINEPVIGACRENIPGAFIIALDYVPAAGTSIRCEVVKAGNGDFEYHFGAEFKLVENIFLLAGFKDRANTLSGGMVFETGNMQLSCAYEYHPFLGGSNSISVGYGF